MKKARKQRGTALITAILVVALATAIAASLTWDLFLDQRRAFGRLAVDQGLMYSLGAESWAKKILRDDAEDNAFDHPGEPWATQIMPLPIEGGQIQGRIEDLNGRFNLNNLIDAQGGSDPAAIESFRRLLMALELDVRLADRMADWIDRDLEPNFPDGAEDSAYLSRQPPFRTANRPITSVSEIMLVYPELGRAGYDQLRPYVAALPRGTVININTAQPPVLLTAAENLGAGEAERIVFDRPQEGWDSIEQLGDLIPEEARASLGVASNWFRLSIRVDIGTQRFTMYSLLHRDGSGSVATVIRSFADE
ncbi:type II secretion system minor pseudopilin GspK [Wenzhouxiangella sp. XN24]|uniref:type II secretion system minor pseudopilin GspK n=1 Tax=Wenzhouxiangella sp. XN24 TaxID=2713569 RepID=UPI0013ED8A68|nr:type II secretion system minor pseudopilin GspK [Wenzhouxiangella sp. XN24]NGX16520.1 type II secretion system minor pseudopilin GspK [Wenzhouxiangella sp. XN24]